MFTQNLAMSTGVRASDISLNVTAASIRVEARFRSTPMTSASMIVASLSRSAINQAATSAGVTVESVSTPTTLTIIVAPPPPSVPPPSAPPGMLCTDKCRSANNGICEDAESLRAGNSGNGDNEMSYGGGAESYGGVEPMSTMSYEGGTPTMMAYSYGGGSNGDVVPTGAPGSCETGTDCTDCGPRPLCTTCSPACRRRGMRLGKTSFCLESMFGDGTCDAACNNWECGHDNDDCSDEEALSVCQPLHIINRGLRSKPANTSFISTRGVLGTNVSGALAAVETTLTQLSPFAVTLDSSTGAWDIAVGFSLQLRWRDGRVPRMPCKLMMSEGFALRTFDNDFTVRNLKQTAKATLMWFPALSLDGAALDYTTQQRSTGSNVLYAITTASFAFTEGIANQTGDPPWSNGAVAPDGATTCHDCLRHTISVANSFTIRPPLFTYFPFDRQTFGFTLTIRDADLFSCDRIFGSGLNETSSAFLDQIIGSEWMAERIWASHPKRPSSTDPNDVDPSACQVKLEVRRNLMIFVVKQILPTIVVVYSSLTSLYMAAEEHTGDRAAIVLVGALILIVNFQSNLGLGNITYLVWWDYFNLASLFMLLAVLLAALYEHYLIQKDEISMAVAFNRITRIAFIWLIYPVVLLALLMFGLSDGSPSLAYFSVVLLLGGNAAIWLGSYCLYRHRLNISNKAQGQGAAALRHVDPSSASAADELQSIFRAYDIESNGMLDSDDVRTMLRDAFMPVMRPDEVNSLMDSITIYANSKGEITAKSFTDLMTVMVLPQANEIRNDSGTGGRSVLATKPTSRFAFRMPTKKITNAPATSLQVAV